MALHGFQYKGDRVWPTQHNVLLDLDDIVRIERFRRTDFEEIW
jgi:hypothetical protein